MRFVAWRGLSDGYRRAVDGHSPWTRDTKDPQPICVEDIGRAELPDPLKATVKAEDIGALAFIPLVALGGHTAIAQLKNRLRAGLEVVRVWRLTKYPFRRCL